MQKIIFATVNKAKLAQIRFAIDYFKFPVEIINGKEVFDAKAVYEEIGETVGQIAQSINRKILIRMDHILPVNTYIL